MTAQMFHREEFISVQEAAHRLGKSVRTLYRWISGNRIRSHKVGRDHLIDPEELDQDIRKHDALGEKY